MTPRSPFPSESWSEQQTAADGESGVSSNGSNNGGTPVGEDAERNGAAGRSGTQSNGDHENSNSDHENSNGDHENSSVDHENSNGAAKNSQGNPGDTEVGEPDDSDLNGENGRGRHIEGSDDQSNGAVLVGDGFAVSERFVAEPEATEPEEHERIIDLEERVDRLSSICEAMWDLVSEELDLELGGLTAKLAEIDASELMPPTVVVEEGSICPNCGNSKPVESNLCLFCSARTPSDEYSPKHGDR